MSFIPRVKKIVINGVNHNKCLVGPKVVWFNELHELFKASGANAGWDTFTEILKTDPRMGNSHMQVPGPDGLFGFGGHCFPKDVSAFLQYAESNRVPQKLLDKANTYNKRYR